MNRKFILGGICAGIVGVVVLSMGFVLNNQANFSKDYVHSQLTEHKITFSPVANLQANQKTIPCLVANAGQQLTTGKQAECYAKYQIGIDMQTIDHGKGYTEDHYAAYLLRLKAAEALRTHPTDPATVALVSQSEALSRTADDLLAGESVRGLLLTAYGFSLLGERGGQAATVCFVAGGLLMLGMLVSFGLAVGTRRRESMEGTLDLTTERSTTAQPISVGSHGEPAMSGASRRRD